MWSSHRLDSIVKLSLMSKTVRLRRLPELGGGLETGRLWGPGRFFDRQPWRQWIEGEGGTRNLAVIRNTVSTTVWTEKRTAGGMNE